MKSNGNTMSLHCAAHKDDGDARPGSETKEAGSVTGDIKSVKLVSTAYETSVKAIR